MMGKVIRSFLAGALGLSLSLGAIPIGTLVLTPSTALAQEGVSHYEVHVNGMVCPFCAYGIEKKLKALPGPIDVNVNLARELATFEAPKAKAPTPEQVRQAVKNAGFTLGELKIDGQKVEG